MTDGESVTEQLLRSLALERRGGITAGLERVRARPDLVDTALRMQSDESDEVRAMALIALLGVTAPGVARVARQGLRDRSPQVRTLAVRILGALDTQALDDVAGALEDPDPRVVQEATRALSTTGPVPELIRGLLGSPNETQRLAGVNLVGQQLAVDLRDVIVSSLRDPVPRVRAEAVRTLAKLGPAVLDHLAPALRDDDEQVREAALRALAAGEETVADATLLRPLLADPAVGVRVLAVDLLQRTGDRSCSDVLPLLQDPELAVRAGAMAAVAAWRCAEAVPQLERAATDAADARDRAQAINALVQFGRLPGPLLIRLLADPDAHVRVLGAKTASGTTNSAVHTALGQALLADPSPNVRRTAAESATGSDLLPALSQATRNDPEPRVRLAALRAIGPFPEASGVGVDALDDQDPRIRAAAARWLGTLDALSAVDALTRRSQIEDDEEVRAELLQASSGFDKAAAGRLAAAAAARPLFDPAGQQRAFTTWLRNLEWYPMSEGVVFYNTGVLQVFDEDEEEDTDARLTYEVSSGRLRVSRNGVTVLDSEYSVDSDEPGRYRLTLPDSGPPLDRSTGRSTFFCVAGDPAAPPRSG